MTKYREEAEHLADYTGLALLMPLEEVYTDLKAAQFKTSGWRSRIKTIQGLCAKYGVSKINALRRIKQVYAIKEAENL